MISQTETKRVDSIFDLPFESIRCLALGRHVGFGTTDPTMVPEAGWGKLSAMQVRYLCDCGRWRRETVDIDTGEILTRSADYGGGTLLWSGSAPTREEARQEYLRRVRTRASGHRDIRTSGTHGRT